MPSRFHKPAYGDVTTEKLKEMYPTDGWRGRYAAALNITR